MPFGSVVSFKDKTYGMTISIAGTHDAGLIRINVGQVALSDEVMLVAVIVINASCGDNYWLAWEMFENKFGSIDQICSVPSAYPNWVVGKFASTMHFLAPLPISAAHTPTH